MQHLLTTHPHRKRVLFSAIVAAVSALVAVFLMPMSNADAADGKDHMVVDDCTVDLPFGYEYEANGSPIDAGVQYLAWFYPGVSIDQLQGADRLVVESIDIDVPLECTFEVAATCDEVTFGTYLDEDGWSVLEVHYGDDSSASLGNAPFTSDVVTIPMDYNPFAYTVYDLEMDRQFSGLLTLDCGDDPAIPTVAPDSGR